MVPGFVPRALRALRVRVLRRFRWLAAALALTSFLSFQLRFEKLVAPPRFLQSRVQPLDEVDQVAQQFFDIFAGSLDPVDNLLINGEADWKDYELELRLRNDDDDTMGVVFRYQNTANYYAVWFARDVAPTADGACDGNFLGARLIKVSASQGAGVVSILANSKITYQKGKVHAVRMRVEGDSIQVFFDADANGKIDAVSERIFNAVDKTHASGAIGLYAYQNGADQAPCSAGGCWFDDVIVRTIEGAPGPSDSDADGFADTVDNCPQIANPDQNDHDGDKLGDACDVDADNDGLTNVDEAKIGADPLDADSDDDGLIDGLEPQPGDDFDGDGLVNVRDPDSDGDGLPDGLEAGSTSASGDTDLSLGWFTPDQDPSTTTNPLVADSDGDGMADGVEDANHNGRVDTCESDPSKADKPPCSGGQVGVDAGGGGVSDASGGGSDASNVGGSDAAKGSSGPLTLTPIGNDSGGCRAAIRPAGQRSLAWLLALALAVLAIGLRRRYGRAKRGALVDLA